MAPETFLACFAGAKLREIEDGGGPKATVATSTRGAMDGGHERPPEAEDRGVSLARGARERAQAETKCGLGRIQVPVGTGGSQARR